MDPTGTSDQEVTPMPSWLSMMRGVSLALSNIWPLSACSELCRRVGARTLSRSIQISDFRGSGRFVCDLAEHMCSHIFWRGAYSGEQLRLLERQLARDSTFVDVGANRGEFSIAAALKAVEGQVVSFEPHPLMYEHLLRNIAINQFANVRALQLGLSDRTDEVPLFEAGGRFVDGSWHAGLGTIHQMDARAQNVGIIRLVPFDVIREELGLHRIDVMKIDVEGAELSVLKGAEATIRACRPMIMIELNEETCRSAGYSARDLVAWLKERSYDIRLIDKNVTLPRLEKLPDFCNAACFPS